MGLHHARTITFSLSVNEKMLERCKCILKKIIITWDVDLTNQKK